MKDQKVFNIEDKQIIVYDNLFSYQENLEIYQFICQQPFVRSNLDNTFDNNKDINIKWSCLLKDSNAVSDLIDSRYRTLDKFNNKRIEIFRQYINFSTTETVDTIHVDSSTGTTGAYTILHYGNFVWDKNWHGETVFYNSDAEEILHATMPKPGRVVIFDSNIPHCARPPSRLAEYARYTIATKLLVIE
jgi:hypothetical protein